MKAEGPDERLGAISDYREGHPNSHRLLNKRSIFINRPKVIISSGYPESSSSLKSTRSGYHGTHSQSRKTEPLKRHHPSPNHHEKEDHGSKGLALQSKSDSQRSLKHRKTHHVKVIPFKNVVLGEHQDKHVNMYVLSCVSNADFEELNREFEEQIINFYKLQEGQYLVVVEMVNSYSDTQCASLLERYGFESYVSSRFYVHDPMKFYAKIDRQFMKYACRPVKWDYLFSSLGPNFSTSLENEELCIRGGSTSFVCGLKATLPYAIRNGKCYIDCDITKDFEKHNGRVKRTIRSNTRLLENSDTTVKKDTCLSETANRYERYKAHAIDDIDHDDGHSDGGTKTYNVNNGIDDDHCNGVMGYDNDSSDQTANKSRPVIRQVISDDDAVVVDDVVDNVDHNDDHNVEVVTPHSKNRTRKPNLSSHIPISVPKGMISPFQDYTRTVSIKTIAAHNLSTEDIPSHYIFIDYEMPNGTEQRRTSKNVTPTVDELCGAFSHKLQSIGSRYLKIRVNGQFPQRVCFLMKSKTDIIKAWKDMHSHIYENGVVLLTLCDEQVAQNFCYNGKPWSCVEEIE